VLDRKMIGTFLMVSTSSYHHSKFGGDGTTHAGSRCENMVCMFLIFLFVCHARVWRSVCSRVA